jgi:tetratricopeptide (TPR) repeat protein
MGKDNDVKATADDSDELTGSVLEPEILIRIAKAAINRNDYQSAIDAYEKVLQIDQGNTQASFLLKRAKYMVEDEKEVSTKSKVKDTGGGAEKDQLENGRAGMLAHQQKIQRISIKPKQKFKVNRNIIVREDGEVYGVDASEDEREMEEVSKTMAIRTKGSIIKRRGILIAFGLAITIIIMIVVGLYAFGFLKF